MGGTLISFAIPIRDRLSDLRISLPTVVKAANFSPPCEICILDYNSPYDIKGFITEFKFVTEFKPDVWISYHRYNGHDYYHQAHASNLAVTSCEGEYIFTSCADIMVAEDLVQALRDLVISSNCGWAYGTKKGHVLIKKSEFIAAGGIDERFEFYGPSDREFFERMKRRGVKLAWIPDEDRLFSHIPMASEDKVKGYRLNLTKAEMRELMVKIYEEDTDKQILVANEGVAWGQF